MLSPAVLAVGISFWSLLEAAAALALAVSLIALAIVTVRVSPTVPSQLARALLLISAAASVVAMLFAAGYGLGQGLHLATVSLPTMVRVHGWLNAVGFALCGLLGWTLAAPKSALPRPGPPFSRLAGRGRIGADYFDRSGCRASRRAASQRAWSIRSTAYRRPDFEPDRVHPAIREFYERTADFTLLVRAEWQAGFGRPSRIYRRLQLRRRADELPGRRRQPSRSHCQPHRGARRRQGRADERARLGALVLGHGLRPSTPPPTPPTRWAHRST